MALGIDPTVDYAFKRLFGDPNHSAVLLHLLNSLFEGQFQVDDVEILGAFPFLRTRSVEFSGEPKATAGENPCDRKRFSSRSPLAPR